MMPDMLSAYLYYRGTVSTSRTDTDFRSSHDPLTYNTYMENLNLTTVDAVIDHLQYLGEVNGAWAQINTEHAAYTGLGIPVRDWDYADNILDTAELLWDVGADEEVTAEQLDLLITAYEQLALDPDLYDAYLLQTVFEVGNVDYNEFLTYCYKAGLEPEVIDEFKELD
jgi:hypothetical protein